MKRGASSALYRRRVTFSIYYLRGRLDKAAESVRDSSDRHWGAMAGRAFGFHWTRGKHKKAPDVGA